MKQVKGAYRTSGDKPRETVHAEDEEMKWLLFVDISEWKHSSSESDNFFPPIFPVYVSVLGSIVVSLILTDTKATKQFIR